MKKHGVWQAVMEDDENRIAGRVRDSRIGRSTKSSLRRPRDTKDSLDAASRLRQAASLRGTVKAVVKDGSKTSIAHDRSYDATIQPRSPATPPLQSSGMPRPLSSRTLTMPPPRSESSLIPVPGRLEGTEGKARSGSSLAASQQHAGQAARFRLR